MKERRGREGIKEAIPYQVRVKGKYRFKKVGKIHDLSPILVRHVTFSNNEPIQINTINIQK